MPVAIGVGLLRSSCEKLKVGKKQLLLNRVSSCGRLYTSFGFLIRLRNFSLVNLFNITTLDSQK